MCDYMSRSVCASDRTDESLGCCVLSPFFHQALLLLSILRSLCICLEVLSDILPVIILACTLSHHNLFPLTSCLRVFIRVCRCFDRQGYCSRGWCLDTGWHCSAPWAHAQIREDIRNPSLHVSFNHTGWRGDVFMDLIMEWIHCVFIASLCMCVCSKYVCVLATPS